MESGNIRQGLWTKANSTTSSNNSDDIDKEYIRLRVGHLRAEGRLFQQFLDEVSEASEEEEGSLVKDFYDRLLGSTFLDENDNKKIMDEEDILVVAPYNVQVNYLKSILPKGAKVGTIDKFQGQQAPATIISMTTSDPESLPRNVDFFFSRGRVKKQVFLLLKTVKNIYFSVRHMSKLTRKLKDRKTLGVRQK